MVARTASRTRNLARPDALLRGEETGDGPTVLLLHAGGERRQVWTPVIDVLTAAGYRCVAYDQRGHGDSDGSRHALAPFAADAAAMLAEEAPGCVVVGASLGGLAALAALADPAVRAKVDGLVLVDVVPDPDADRVRAFLASGAVLGDFGPLVEDTLAQAPRLREITAGLDVPILLVRAGVGSSITADEADRLVRLAPHATATSILDAGHLIARDQPVKLAETIATAAAEWRALALLRELGAGSVDHPGGNLLDHLQRVRDLVREWGGSRRLQFVALCHAAYGTDGFPHALLPLDERDRLQAAIGDEAESLVYLYDACDRTKTYARLGETPLPLTDRFTGEVVPLDATDLNDFVVLTVANELDVARKASLAPETRRDLRALVSALAAYAPEAAAQALADPSL
ncbi:alpha/beta fold hydrolase [Actinomadura rupiterrae]|uniref:alpha/beta fold hydrolase n=1 Tax=Actinomadura rupiterrae TaxID=559627 RepID=UPI0020A54E00|nr:alpha/beta fold hydrolase [Actinomadura rupiterrae]MCP2342496.1 pimeloyl-ACP methyl ester carboxylesterase [Actinomadura rupiterrae]